MPNGQTDEGHPVVSFVNVPMTSSELRNFKSQLPPLAEDPLKVAEQLQLFLGPNIYTWTEMVHILSYLFTPEEITQIRAAAMKHWDEQRRVGDGPAGDEKYPQNDPKWDNNDQAHRQNMQDLRTMIIQGIKTAVPRNKNFVKAFGVEQKKDESPHDFSERLKNNIDKYSGLQPETPAYNSLINVQFVTKAWPDIQKKLQKLENWAGSDITVLLREAQKVSVNRDEVKAKSKSQLMMSAVQSSVRNEVKRQQVNWQKGNEKIQPELVPRGKFVKPPGGQNPVRESDMRRCFACDRPGHFA